MRKRTATFEAELMIGHKDVAVVIVPFDPESFWRAKPVRLAGRRHGWPVTARIGKARFIGYVGEWWGTFFVALEPAARKAVGARVGDVLACKLDPLRTPEAIAMATEQSKSTTQPRKARTDVVESHRR